MPVSPSPCMLPRLSPSITQATPRPRVGSCLIFHPLPLPLYLNSMSGRGGKNRKGESLRPFIQLFFFSFKTPGCPGGQGAEESLQRSVGAHRVDCWAAGSPACSPKAPSRACCLHIQRETNLKMNPGTEIPLDKLDSQVYYLSGADSRRYSGAELSKQHSRPLRLTAQATHSPGAGTQVEGQGGSLLPATHCLPSFLF